MFEFFLECFCLTDCVWLLIYSLSFRIFMFCVELIFFVKLFLCFCDFVILCFLCFMFSIILLVKIIFELKCFVRNWQPVCVLTKLVAIESMA